MLQKIKKKYFARALLHTAGQSNQIGMNKGFLLIGAGAAMLGCALGIALFHYVLPLRFEGILFLITFFGLILLAYLMITYGEMIIRAYWQGKEGERYVRDELEPLTKAGYEIINDIPAENFNIDFLLIGPSGVYVVEVKNPTKTKDDMIVCQDGTLYIGPKELDSKSEAFKKMRRPLNKPDPLRQVHMTTGWVRRFLESAGQKKLKNITPVVLFPKFWVENHIGDVWAMNSKSFVMELPRHTATLTPNDISELTAIVRAHVQTKIMAEEF